jgi:DNA polymerase I-like protein with 3'-5' exonuclease and polymerase domains
MTGWDPEKISHDKRTRTSTKNVHFGIFFGSSPKGVYDFVRARTPEDQEPMSMDEITRAMRRYFKRYPGVKAFMQRQREFAAANGYVETMFGMKQPLNVTDERGGDDDEDDGRESSWQNQAINGPVQGTAHQMLGCGLINLHRQPEKYTVLETPVADVHDALYFNPLFLRLMEAYRKARELMERDSLRTIKKDFPQIEWTIPIITEGEAGFSLGCNIEINEQTELGDFLVSWYHKRKKQDAELMQEFRTIS